MSFFRKFPQTEYDLLNDSNLRTITDIFRNVDVNEKQLDGFLNYKFERIEDGERPDQMSFRLYDSSDFYWTFFICNDFLKEGYNSWPKGFGELETFIDNEYGKYSVLAVDSSTLRRICNIQNVLSQTLTLGSIAGIKIHKIDETRQQIWLKGNHTILNNVEAENFEITGHADSPTVLTALDGWAYVQNAPYSYNSFSSTTGDIIRTTDFTSYQKYHEDENEERSSIKVIRPGLINEFVDRYKELLNE